MNQCYCDRSSGMCEHGHRHGGVDSVLATYMNSYYTNRLIGLSLKTQLRDIFPSLLLAAGMGITVYYSISLFSSDLLKIIGGVVIGVVFYVMASVILRIEEFKELLLIIKK